MNAAAIIVAAGSGRRFKSRTPKQFLLLNGKPVIEWSILAFTAVRAFTQVILVAPQSRIPSLKKYRTRFNIDIVPGGAERPDSVKAGLACLAPGITHIAIHDGARPLITPALIRAGLKAAQEHGASVIALPARDTVKLAGRGSTVERTLPRSTIWLAQTPQTFRRDLIEHAYAGLRAPDITDDAQAVELAGRRVRIVPGDPDNIKITLPEDLVIAAALLRRSRKLHA